VPIGRVTRGTTGTNRLRRVDRFISALPSLTAAVDPLVVDLGFGASATTTLELQARLARSRPDVEVIGIEIDPARVEVASASARPGVSFRLGGFEVPLPGDRRPTVIRAMNVLRQYDESAVLGHWHRMAARLQPGGSVVEGTCSELGRVGSWVDLRRTGPVSLTLGLRATGLEHPSIVAERLPKALIHRNVPGEPVHALMVALDRHWRVHAPLSAYGPRQRLIAVAASLAAEGWPVLGGARRARLGEITVAWDAVAPLGFDWDAR
jgi:hypothetical protein